MDLDLPLPEYMRGKRELDSAKLPPAKVGGGPKFPPPRRGGGGGGGGGSTAASSAAAPSSIVDERILALADLSLETAAGKREALGLLQWTILVPAVTTFAQEGLAEGRDFAEESQNKKGLNIGSAHVRICLRALKGLAEMEGWKDDRDFTEALQAFWVNVVNKVGPDILEEYVQTWRMMKPKVHSKEVVRDMGEYCKLIMRLKPLTPSQSEAATLQEVIVKKARAAGWQVKLGTPPKSQKERKVAQIAADIRG